MPEIDNCPICNTTCELEYGLEKSIGVEVEKEILYATCKTCKTRWRRRDDPEVSGRMIYEKWTCRIPEFTLPFPLMGGGIKLPPRWCRWTKEKERYIPVGATLGLKSEETITRKGKVVEETVALGHKESAFYDFELVRGDKIEGTIVSDEPVDVWFMDVKNLDKLERQKNFEVEVISEGIYETKLSIKARKKNLWFVVIRNPRKTSAKVKVNIYSVHKKDRV